MAPFKTCKILRGSLYLEGASIFKSLVLWIHVRFVNIKRGECWYKCIHNIDFDDNKQDQNWRVLCRQHWRIVQNYLDLSFTVLNLYLSSSFNYFDVFRDQYIYVYFSHSDYELNLLVVEWQIIQWVIDCSYMLLWHCCSILL